MSTTMSYREQQRADRAAEREQAREDARVRAEAEADLRRLDIEAEAKRREADRLDAAARAEAARAAEELKARQDTERREQQRLAKLAADKERAKAKAKARAERRERRAAAVKAVPAWLAEHLDLAAALVVMGCSIIPALISQAASLSDTGITSSMGWAGGLLVALLPVMLECSAWAATAGEAKAMKSRRSPWPYRIAVYVFASLAAWINWQHGQNVGGDQYGTLLGSVLAASSVVPIAVWQLVQVGRHREFKDEMRRARQHDRDVKATREARQKELPEVWATAVQLRAIAGHHNLTDEDAWHAAYAVHEGAGDDVLDPKLLVLLSTELIGLRADAEDRLALVLADLSAARGRRLEASAGLFKKDSEGSVNGAAKGSATPPTPVARRVQTGLLDSLGRPLYQTVSPQINPSIPPSAHTSETAPARTRGTTPAPARKARAKKPARTLSSGARKAAAHTARTSSPEERVTLDAWLADEFRDGRGHTWQDVRDKTLALREEAGIKGTQDPSRSWCYARIAAAQKSTGIRIDVTSDQKASA
ncbi:hypothetical protein RVR_P158 (plasmid) [Actinacidiphila reveromycinica]|uniref:DUF2637 domain-containing protein n=1 Tax=Actinacidiphila reveromycinica TaxID=659352 RepID=A0A7U3V3V2_9ACTN|nr:DUF2637 domain-containing protein [Streptomyces sp. SN-593]BBG20681.1 hypothetical protein RVR_P158 [Streptomyces sp. SN-593]